MAVGVILIVESRGPLGVEDGRHRFFEEMHIVIAPSKNWSARNGDSGPSRHMRHSVGWRDDHRDVGRAFRLLLGAQGRARLTASAVPGSPAESA
jgi:hypothetical protein